MIWADNLIVPHQRLRNFSCVALVAMEFVELFVFMMKAELRMILDGFTFASAEPSVVVE